MENSCVRSRKGCVGASKLKSIHKKKTILQMQLVKNLFTLFFNSQPVELSLHCWPHCHIWQCMPCCVVELLLWLPLAVALHAWQCSALQLILCIGFMFGLWPMLCATLKLVPQPQMLSATLPFSVLHHATIFALLQYLSWQCC